jgi:hypothetical protein
VDLMLNQIIYIKNLNTLQNPLDPRNMIIIMHYFFKGEPGFQFANVSPSSWCPILKFWSNKVNGTPSNFIRMIIVIKSCVVIK